MHPRLFAVLACAAVTVAGLAGCSSGEPDSASPSTSSGPHATATATPSPGVEYSGPALPGLAARPAWSMPYAGSSSFELQAVMVGDGVAVAQRAGDYRGSGPG